MLPHPQHHCCPSFGKQRQYSGSILLQSPQRVPNVSKQFSHSRLTAVLVSPATDAATAASPTPPAVHNTPVQVHAHAAHAAAPAADAEPKYLSYQEYLATQEARKQQQQEQQQQWDGDVAGQRADETAHASTSAPSNASSGQRVPWNKGRKHSAMTIARISGGVQRALARPEVRAKLDAWNQSRVGTTLSDEIRAKISERQRTALAARRAAMSPEELEAESAKRSVLAKRLWQDPDYVAVTLPAMQEAGIKRRGTRHRSRAAAAADEEPDGDGVSSSSSSSSRRSGSRAKRGTNSRGAAAGEGSSSGGSDQEPHAGGKKARQPSQKELAALAKLQQEHQREHLQKQLERMLQTQQLVATTEQKVLQLRSNMAAFENNPQAKANAATAFQQAQSYLGPARELVSKLLESLDKHGVHWDPVSGQMTHINHEELDAKAAPKARSSKPAGASSSSGRSKAGASSKAAGAASQGAEMDGVVRSSRRKQVQERSEAAAGLVVSSRRRGAAAEAAASGGSRAGPGSTATWKAVGADAGPTSRAVPVNGNGSNGNGHSSSTVSSGMYVPLRRSVSSHEEDVDEDA